MSKDSIVCVQAIATLLASQTQLGNAFWPRCFSLDFGNIIAMSKGSIMDTQCQAVCLTAFEVISMRVLLQNCTVLYSIHTTVYRACMRYDWRSARTAHLSKLTGVL